MAQARPRRSLLRRAPAPARARGSGRVGATGALPSASPEDDEILAAEEADDEALACFDDDDLDQTLDRAETRTLSVFPGGWDPRDVVEVNEGARGTFLDADREDALVYEEDDGEEDWGWDDPTETVGPRVPSPAPSPQPARSRGLRPSVIAVVLGSGGLMTAGGLLVLLGLGAGLALWWWTDAPVQAETLSERPVAPPILQPAPPEGPSEEAPTPEIVTLEAPAPEPSRRARRAAAAPPAPPPVEEEPALPAAEPEPVPEPVVEPEPDETPRRGLFRRRNR